MQEKKKKKKKKTFILHLVCSVSCHFCHPGFVFNLSWPWCSVRTQTDREGMFADESGAVHPQYTHFAGPNRCHGIFKYRCFEYFQMFSYLNRGHINIHDCKHILTLAEKTLNTSVHRPTWKCHWKTGYSCHILFVYLFIYFYQDFFFSTSKEVWNKW